MLRRLRLYAAFVRVGHSLFALPFALTGALFAFQHAPFSWSRLGWIVAAMVTARSAAMGFNREVDARFDALNPRTAGRELPRGALSSREALAFVVASSLAFVAVTYALGRLCFALSPLALAIVFWYSLAKRYTHYTQVFLGVAMAVAPVGGWLAAGGRAGWEPWLLALAIGCWVGGFDVLYACQDVEFDRAHNLKSIPVRFGVARALAISRLMHALAVAALGAIGLVVPLGPVYLMGVVGVGALLAYEQALVRPDDLSRIPRAFDLNGYVGLFYLLVTVVALYLR
jgi:4-hydroxybenzoate polyprenyltransferase